MDSLPPTGSHNIQTAVIVNPSTSLPRELLLTIFVYHLLDVNTFTQASHNLSLVCREWKQITETPQIWLGIFYRTGISLPFRPPQNFHQAHSVLRAQIGDLLRNNLLSWNHNPFFKKTTYTIDFSKYPYIHFHENSYVVAHSQNEISIFPLSPDIPPEKTTSTATLFSSYTPQEVIPFSTPTECSRKITLSSNILYLRTTQGIIYCSLANGELLAFSIDHEEGDSPLFSLEALSEKERADLSLGDVFIKHTRVLVSDKWIVTTTGQLTKIFNKFTNGLISILKTHYIMRGLQIDRDKLYWTCSCPEKFNRLLCLDLNERKTEIFIRDLPWEISSLHIWGNRGFYLASIASEGQIQLSIESFDLHSSVLDRSYPIQIPGGHIPPHLIIINNLALLVHEGYPTNIPMFSGPNILECIDLQSGISCYLQQGYFIHLYSTSIFQDTILFTCNNRVVTMKFFAPLHEDVEMRSPMASLKRPLSLDLAALGESKRQRTE